MRSLVHIGNDEEAQQFVDENKDRFKQAAAAIRATALAIDGNHLSEIFPVLNREWLSWLEHSPHFADLLNTAGPERTSVNHRVHADDAAFPPALLGLPSLGAAGPRTLTGCENWGSAVAAGSAYPAASAVLETLSSAPPCAASAWSPCSARRRGTKA